MTRGMRRSALTLVALSALMLIGPGQQHVTGEIAYYYLVPILFAATVFFLGRVGFLRQTATLWGAMAIAVVLHALYLSWRTPDFSGEGIVLFLILIFPIQTFCATVALAVFHFVRSLDVNA